MPIVCWWFSCSVIDTDARPGPRNLIDDSLMTESDANSTASGDSTSYTTHMVGTVDPIFGIEVHHELTDSDQEQDGLLDETDE